MVDGSKGVTRGGPSPGKVESDAHAPLGKPGASLLPARKNLKKALLFWLPWQNLLQGSPRAKTGPSPPLPPSDIRQPEKEIKEQMPLQPIGAMHEEKTSERPLEKSDAAQWLAPDERPSAAFPIWISSRLQIFFEELSAAYWAEQIRKGGFLMGVAGLLWYDRQKKRPGSLPLSLLVHLILLVALAWLITDTL